MEDGSAVELLQREIEDLRERLKAEAALADDYFKAYHQMAARNADLRCTIDLLIDGKSWKTEAK